MKKETLQKARKLIKESFESSSSIDIVDRIELMTYLWLCLTPHIYIENNKTLQKTINNDVYDSRKDL